MPAKPLFLGVDYGKRKIALAVVDSDDRIYLLEDLDLKRPNDRAVELLLLADFMADCIEPWTPDLPNRPYRLAAASIESSILGGSKNVQVAVNLAYTAGAMTLVLTELLVQTTITPSGTWKKTSIGRGDVGKTEVMAWAQNRWPDAFINTQDQADALGLAVHACKTYNEGENS